MTPIVSIIMGSTSDLPVMEKAAAFLDSMEIPFEMNALSAHRTPAEVESFAREAKGRGVKVILGVNGALNAAILAVEMLALSDAQLATRLEDYKSNLKQKIVKANQYLAEVKYKFKTN